MAVKMMLVGNYWYCASGYSLSCRFYSTDECQTHLVHGCLRLLGDDLRVSPLYGDDFSLRGHL